MTSEVKREYNKWKKEKTMTFNPTHIRTRSSRKRENQEDLSMWMILYIKF